MKIVPSTALLLAALAGQALAAADKAMGPPPKGTICFVNSIRHTNQVPLFCEGLGDFESIAAIYERGYRVTATGSLEEAGTGIYLIIEKK